MTLVHPPAPICPSCHSLNLSVKTVSGRGTIASFTINHQPWYPLMPLPYVVALVEIEEDPRVRLVTNIVGCDPGEVRIGMSVNVEFEQVEDVYLPLFRPHSQSGKGRHE